MDDTDEDLGKVFVLIQTAGGVSVASWDTLVSFSCDFVQVTKECTMKDTPCVAQWGLRGPSDSKSSILREEEGSTCGVLRFLTGRCSGKVVAVVRMNLCAGTLCRDDRDNGLSKAFAVTWRPRERCALLGQ